MIAHTGDTYAMFGYNGRDGVITDDTDCAEYFYEIYENTGDLN